MIWFLRFCSLLPKNAMSQAFGWLARLKLPPPLNTWLCRGFATLYGVDLDAAADPIEHYQSLEEFFIRKLKPGLRPVQGPYCSPSDGMLIYSQTAEQGGRAVQVKGIYYSLDELVFGQGVRHQLQWTWFSTIYLAPQDYHRVHSPVDGRLEQIRYFPGELWPVNNLFVKLVPQLFTKNERLVFDFTLPNGGKVAVVMVGALNVGRMQTPFWPEFFTNDRLFGVYPKVHDLGVGGVSVAIGDELGTFMLGSTVVVAMDQTAQELVSPKYAELHFPVKLGETLSKLQSTKETQDA